MLSRMIVSQNSTPGSALFQALWTIFSHSLRADISLRTHGWSLSTGNCCVKYPFSAAARINSSLILTLTLAPVTLPSSILASMKAPASGCLMETESISAPRLPSCATSLVELLKRSMNGTSPVEVRAELLTGVPLGRIWLKSWPTPPRRFMSCTCSSSSRMMAP